MRRQSHIFQSPATFLNTAPTAPRLLSPRFAWSFSFSDHYQIWHENYITKIVCHFLSGKIVFWTISNGCYVQKVDYRSSQITPFQVKGTIMFVVRAKCCLPVKCQFLLNVISASTQSRGGLVNDPNSDGSYFLNHLTYVQYTAVKVLYNVEVKSPI